MNSLITITELNSQKRPYAWKDFKQKEKGMTEDEMVGWHH